MGSGAMRASMRGAIDTAQMTLGAILGAIRGHGHCALRLPCAASQSESTAAGGREGGSGLPVSHPARTNQSRHTPVRHQVRLLRLRVVHPVSPTTVTRQLPPATLLPHTPPGTRALRSTTPPGKTHLPLDCHCNSGVNSQYGRGIMHLRPTVPVAAVRPISRSLAAPCPERFPFPPL